MPGGGRGGEGGGGCGGLREGCQPGVYVPLKALFLVLLASPVGFEPVRQMYMYIASQGTRIAILKYRIYKSVLVPLSKIITGLFYFR